MGQLQSGLTKSTEEKVSNTRDAQKYLGELNESKSSEKFYIPKEVLEEKISKSFEYVHVT